MSRVSIQYREWAEPISPRFGRQRPEQRKVLAWLMVAIYAGKEM